MKAEAHFTTRSGRSYDVALVFFGSQLAYGSVIMGAMPITFGLTVAQSLWAILVGTLICAAGLAGMPRLGPGSGTNWSAGTGDRVFRADRLR